MPLVAAFENTTLTSSRCGENTCTAPRPSSDVSVTFNPGDVAYGYSDGYWTTKREWRTWEKPEYVVVYRKHPGARYYEYRHDRDPDLGWRGEVVIKR